jgi:hypothetical protein
MARSAIASHRVLSGINVGAVRSSVGTVRGLEGSAEHAVDTQAVQGQGLSSKPSARLAAGGLIAVFELGEIPV